MDFSYIQMNEKQAKKSQLRFIIPLVLFSTVVIIIVSALLYSYEDKIYITHNYNDFESDVTDVYTTGTTFIGPESHTSAEILENVTNAEVAVDLPKHKVRKHHKKRVERVLQNSEDIHITDCGDPSEEIIVDSFVIEPTPLNLEKTSTVNSKIYLRGGLYWTTMVDVQAEKYLFGLKWLKIKLPCFLDYFGSCHFSLCDMFRLHNDEQFCDYVLNNYNMTCQCPDIITRGVFELKDFQYKPVMDRILKYFSWIATGWFNMKLRFYDRITKQEYMCLKINLNIVMND